MSDRFAEVAELRERGLPHRVVAERLGLSQQTTRTYVKRMNARKREAGLPAPAKGHGGSHESQMLRGNRTVQFLTLDGEGREMTWTTREERNEVLRVMAAQGHALKYMAWRLGLNVNSIRRLFDKHPELKAARPRAPVLLHPGKSIRVSSETYTLIEQYARKRAIPIHRALHYLIEQASQKS